MSRILKPLGLSSLSVVLSCFILIHPAQAERLEFKNHPAASKATHCMRLKDAGFRRACAKRKPAAAASLWRRAAKHLGDKWESLRGAKHSAHDVAPPNTLSKTEGRYLVAKLPDALSDETQRMFSNLNPKALNDVPVHGRDIEIRKLQTNLVNRDVVFLTGNSPHDRQSLLNGLVQNLQKNEKLINSDPSLQRLSNLRVVTVDTSFKKFYDLDGDFSKNLNTAFSHLQPDENMVLHINGPEPFLKRHDAGADTHEANLEHYISSIQQQFHHVMQDRPSRLTILIECSPGQVRTFKLKAPHGTRNSFTATAKALTPLEAKKSLNQLARRLEEQSAAQNSEVYFSKEILDFISDQGRRFYGDLGHPGGAYNIMKNLVEQRASSLKLMNEGNTTFGEKIQKDLDTTQDLLQRVNNALQQAQGTSRRPKFAVDQQPLLTKKIKELELSLEKEKAYVQQVMRDRQLLKKADDITKQLIQQNPDASQASIQQLFNKQWNQQELKMLSEAQSRTRNITREDVALFIVDNNEGKETLENLLSSAKRLSLEEKLNKFKTMVFGQKQAAQKIAQALRSLSLVTTKSSDKARRVMLFVGPSGVGKTESARAMQRVQDMNLIKVNMSELNQPHTVSRFFGSPPGYTGADVESLAKQIDDTPNSVILIDEFEKADPEVRQAFLGVLDDGVIEDKVKGVKASLKETVVAITSNLGQNRLQPGMTKAQVKSIMQASSDSRSQVADEFFNRIDDVVVFEKLKVDELNQIMGRDLKQFNEDVAHSELINFSMSEKSKTALSQYVQDTTAGSGREMASLTKTITDELNAILKSSKLTYELPSGELKSIDFQNGDEIAVHIKPKKTKIPQLDDLGNPVVDDQGREILEEKITDIEISYEVL